MRASDAAVSHLTDECVDAATACSSRVTQLYGNTSVAFKEGLSEAGAGVRVVLAKLDRCSTAQVLRGHNRPRTSSTRGDNGCAADCRAVLQRGEHDTARVDH